MRRRAIELLGPSADPSRNYVMTEVVHCKSSGETGVAAAAQTCAERYLDKILSLSAAPVVVVVGKQAHAMLKLRFPELCDPPYLYTKELGGRPREVVFIWHPASRMKGKTIAGLHGAESLDRLRALAAQPLPQL
jgi:uracil-DNA glycosylase